MSAASLYRNISRIKKCDRLDEYLHPEVSDTRVYQLFWRGYQGKEGSGKGYQYCGKRKPYHYHAHIQRGAPFSDIFVISLPIALRHADGATDSQSRAHSSYHRGDLRKA